MLSPASLRPFQYHFVIAVWRAKTHDSGREMRATFAVIVTVCFATIAPADDFKTIDGKEYKNVKVKRVDPDGIVLRTKSGISKLYFTELPKEVQERFHYDAAKGNAYSAEQNANLDALRKQQEESMRQRQEATARSSTKPVVIPDATKPMATSGIETLPHGKAATVDEQRHRIGAICKDGSESGTTGRGACSRHGGVRCWKYSDGTCR
jgi:hypothetical protein